MKLIKFTPEGLKELDNKIAELKEARPAAVKELSRARELGDLSENGLYTAAKQRLKSIDSQLRRLEAQRKLAEVVKSKKVIVIENGKQIQYEIVGDYEADPANFKVSSNSPIGNALINAKLGEEVKIETPRGTRILKVLTPNNS